MYLWLVDTEVGLGCLEQTQMHKSRVEKGLTVTHELSLGEDEERRIGHRHEASSPTAVRNRGSALGIQYHEESKSES
jgi:hypothetical protein